ncbi:hypothetical protein BJX65DRAFT_316080 [Aspergillus insuetus]
MDRVTHVSNPDGEVIIVLQNPNAPFAELKPAPEWIMAEESVAKPTSGPVEEPVAEPAEEPVEEEPAELGFTKQKILTGGWKESITYLQRGSVEITTDSWDVNALLIMLRIIHCQSYQIPQKLTLEMLAKVAVLADYHDCREALGFLANTGINSLDESIPVTYGSDLMLWEWVSWFFHLPAQFKQATSTVMSSSSNWIDSMGLPIPNKVMESMNSHRQGAIPSVVNRLDKTRDEFMGGTQGCSLECRSIMYGALTLQMRSNALLAPTPIAPFPNSNYKTLVQKVLSFTPPQ